MNYVAIDLGAESGRVMLGRLRSGQITLEEIHRFPNTPIRDGDSIYWNIDAIWSGIQGGLRRLPSEPIASMSVDSWGVDYVLLDARGEVIAPTHHYRDPRTRRASEAFLKGTPWATIFAETGIQYMPINTLFQLASETPERLACASQILGIGDYFNHRLGGAARIEVSMASTFQLYNPIKRDWSELLLKQLGLKRSLLAPLASSGESLGANIVATCSHDTGAAVAATPLEPNAAYLSSGTWSLMGVERAEPIINDLARELNFTNEIGHGHTVRLLKNISGLWLLQECRRIWAGKGQNYDYSELTRLAETVSDVATFNPADPRFLAPADMTDEIAASCRETNQRPPKTPGEFTRSIFESLAQLYRQTLKQLEQLTGSRIEVLHIVGGGSKNRLLNQLTADFCGVPVLAGPVEATALGNILIQAIASGEVRDLTEGRELVRRNFPLERFTSSKSPAKEA